MAKLKVLPLEFWMDLKMLDEDERKFHPETEPVFNRDGYYLLEDKCWFEVEGEAFINEPSDFKHALKMLNYKPLREIEYKHISELLKTGYKSKELRDLINIEEHCRDLRRIKRETMLGFLKD